MRPGAFVYLLNTVLMYCLALINSPSQDSSRVVIDVAAHRGDYQRLRTTTTILPFVNPLDEFGLPLFDLEATARRCTCDPKDDDWDHPVH